MSSGGGGDGDAELETGWMNADAESELVLDWNPVGCGQKAQGRD